MQGFYGLAVATLLGVALVTYRGLARARTGEPLKLTLSHFGLAFAPGLVAAIGAAIATYTLVVPRVPALAPYAFWLCLSVWASLTLATFVVSRTLRDAFTLRLPGAFRAAPSALFALLGIAFVWLTYTALHLPVSHGSRYVLRHEIVRFSALATGVVFLLGVLSAALPSLLDWLERGGLTAFVGARHVRATKSGFLTVISVLSISGVAVSSCALCSVVSIMGGFGQDLKRKIQGNNAHIVVDLPAQLTGFADYEATLTRVKRVRGVRAATPVVAGEAMASSNANTAGVLLRGVDPSTIGQVIDLQRNIEFGRLDYLVDDARLARLPPEEIIGASPRGDPLRKGPDVSAYFPSSGRQTEKTYPGVVVGRELARSLHLLVGDEILLISPLGDLGPMGVMPRARRFRVAAIFYSGMYEYDATHVYVRLDVAQRFFSLEDKATTIDVKVDDPASTEAMLPDVQATVKDRPELRVRDWREMNKNLFSALKLERIATFIVLSIAIMVASFCIICTLLLMVTEKGKEIAILKALGTSDGGILKVFMLEGVIIGAIGTLFGVATGVATCVGLKWFGVRLDPDVYYIDRLPVATNPADYALVATSALVICTLATVYPAIAASRLRPVDGLRHE